MTVRKVCQPNILMGSIFYSLTLCINHINNIFLDITLKYSYAVAMSHKSLCPSYKWGGGGNTLFRDLLTLEHTA